MVVHEGLDGLAGQGLELHFVEDDEGLALHQPDAVDELEPQEDVV